MQRKAVSIAALALASCAKSSSSADVHASFSAAVLTRATDSGARAIAIGSCRAYSVLGFVPGSGVLRDGELAAAEVTFRDMLQRSYQPVIVVGFGDSTTTAGDGASDRRLALRRASFVTHRLEAMGVRVAKPAALPLQSEATSAVIYFGCRA